MRTIRIDKKLDVSLLVYKNTPQPQAVEYEVAVQLYTARTISDDLGWGTMFVLLALIINLQFRRTGCDGLSHNLTLILPASSIEEALFAYTFHDLD